MTETWIHVTKSFLAAMAQNKDADVLLMLIPLINNLTLTYLANNEVISEEEIH